MPIEQLLALYHCVKPVQPTFTTSAVSKRKSKTSRNAGIDTSLMPPPETPKASTETSPNEPIKEEKSENAATAETNTEMETEIDSKSHTDMPVKGDTETEAKIEVPTDDQSQKDDNVTSKVTEIAEQSSKSEVEQERVETEPSEKENSSKIETKPDDDSHANGENAKDSDDTEASDVKGK